MGILDLFKNKENPIKTYEDFWDWFRTKEASFFRTISDNVNVEQNFVDKLSAKLNELGNAFFFLAGMLNDTTAELIITADGSIKDIPYVEDLVNQAPKLDKWKFIALKPPLDIKEVNINMDNHEFNASNLNFYSIEHKAYPDEIDLVLVHDDFDEKKSNIFTNGTFLFLDNFLGELNFAITIDKLIVTSPQNAEQELIPVHKLKDYLIWREKEFIEKYEAMNYNSENDSYATLEATIEGGKPLLAIVNSDLLNWDRKPSHPWILEISINYSSSDKNGFPDDKTYEQLNLLEDRLMDKLKDSDGYLNIGRQTADNQRNIYFACKEFRNASRSTSNLLKEYAAVFDTHYDIYKDKYWQSIERFIPG